MKKIIRLTESDLHNIITESVNRILKETMGDPTGSVLDAFENWMQRNNIECGYYENPASGYIETIRGVRVKAPNVDVQLSNEDMMEYAIEHYPEWQPTEEDLIQWFNDDAPGLDVNDFVNMMNEQAEEESNNSYDDWYEDIDFHIYEQQLNREF